MTKPLVLIVDDDPDMLEVLEMVLCGNGYSCRTASNGLEALEQVKVERPGLVLLDMLMPIMNGWDTANALRERYGHTIPIIVVTASEHAGERAADVDADGFLAKPFDIEELRKLVDRHIVGKEGRATG